MGQTGSVLWRLAGAEAIQLQTDQLINLLKAAPLILASIFWHLIACLLIFIVILVISILVILVVIFVGPILLLIDWKLGNLETQQGNQLAIPGPDGDMM